MSLKTICALIILPFLLLPTGAFASLIGDEVTCFYDVDVGAAVFIGDCSTESAPYTLGPALVNDDGFTDPEFFLGADIFGPGSFLVGVEIDIGDDYIEIAPTASMIGQFGDLFIEIGSLDWVNDPSGIIIAATLSGTGLGTDAIDVSHTDDSVAIEFSNFFVAGNSFIRVDLATASSVPIPASPSLILLGLGFIAASRLLRR